MASSRPCPGPSWWGPRPAGQCAAWPAHMRGTKGEQSQCPAGPAATRGAPDSAAAAAGQVHSCRAATLRPPPACARPPADASTCWVPPQHPGLAGRRRVPCVQGGEAEQEAAAAAEPRRAAGLADGLHRVPVGAPGELPGLDRGAQLQGAVRAAGAHGAPAGAAAAAAGQHPLRPARAVGLLRPGPRRHVRPPGRLRPRLLLAGGRLARARPRMLHLASAQAAGRPSSRDAEAARLVRCPAHPSGAFRDGRLPSSCWCAGGPRRRWQT